MSSLLTLKGQILQKHHFSHMSTLPLPTQAAKITLNL